MNKTLVVNQSNELITAQYRMPLLSKKVFAMAIARLNPKGTILTSCFNAKDLSSLIDSNDPNLPARILGAANDIMHIALTLKQGDKETITRAFSQVTFDYSTKDIKVEFPSVLKEHLLDLQSQYSNYLLQNIIDLTNSTHIRLFEILRSKANLRTWIFNIEDLFYTLQLPESYKNFALLEQKFLIPAQKELDENTGLKFTYEKITKGKKVTKLKFNITYLELTESKSDQTESKSDLVNHVPEVRKTIKKAFEAEVKGLKKINKLSSPELSTRLKQMILSVNGDDSRKTIRDFVDNHFLARDSRALREHIKEIQPDMDLTFDFYPEDGGDTQESVKIPIGVTFFWPDA